MYSKVALPWVFAYDGDSIGSDLNLVVLGLSPSTFDAQHLYVVTSCDLIAPVLIGGNAPNSCKPLSLYEEIRKDKDRKGNTKRAPVVPLPFLTRSAEVGMNSSVERGS